MPQDKPDFLGSAEVCAYVGFDRSTLSRWVKDGTARPVMRLSEGPRGAYLFTRAEAERLHALFADRKRGAA